MKLGGKILSSTTKNPLNFEGDPDIRPNIWPDIRFYQLNKICSDLHEILCEPKGRYYKHYNKV